MQHAREIVAPDIWMRDRPWIDHPEADIEAYIATLKQHPDYDLAAQLAHWQQYGYAVFEAALPEARIEACLADIEYFRGNFSAYDIPIEVRGEQLTSRQLDNFPADLTGVKLNQMHAFSKRAAQLSLTRNVVDFLGHVFRAPPAVCQSLTFWRGSEQPVHIDYPYVREQRPLTYLAASWIPLEDVHPDAGPLGYYPGAHDPGRSGFFDWGEGSVIHDEHASRSPMEFACYLQGQMASAGISRQEFCPKRGDVFLWHANLPHEGTPVKDPARTRKSYVTHYTAHGALPERLRYQDITGTPIGVFENGGYCYRPEHFSRLPVLPSWDSAARGRFGWIDDRPA